MRCKWPYKQQSVFHGVREAKEKLDKRILTKTCNLPDPLLTEIGRLITVHSCLEHELLCTCATLLRLSIEESRIALCSQSTRGRLDLIKKLLELNKVAIQFDIDSFAKAVGEFEEIRNWIAHGVWAIDSCGPRLQITRGYWQPEGAYKRVDRKITPAGALIGLEQLSEISSEGVQILEAIQDLSAQISAQL